MLVLAAGFVLEEKTCAVVWDLKRLKIKGESQNCSFHLEIWGLQTAAITIHPRALTVYKNMLTLAAHILVLQNKDVAFKARRSF